ncbi:D-cysteine desulfhydrase family protein [bacterium]|nr:D-cysteine desulfhydrase family protein [bacterium]
MLKRIQLANIPTPLHRLNKLSELWESDIWIKRDDLTGSGLMGNKVRKLEYLLADASEKGADTVITAGGMQSNHCRAVAIACAQLGFKCRLLLRGNTPSDFDGNLMLDKLAGAQMHFITEEEYYSNLPSEFNRIAEEVRSEGGRAYMIPEGGSNAIGAWGYVEALRELRKQCFSSKIFPDRIICATGSGGTHAGLLMGALLENWDVEIDSVSVCYDHDETIRIVLEIIDSSIDLHKLDICVSRQDIKVIDGYIGEGYAKAGREVFDLITEVVRNEGIFVDPVYTGKAMLALKQETAKGNMKGTTLFWHTGGLFGLFPFRNELTG